MLADKNFPWSEEPELRIWIKDDKDPQPYLDVSKPGTVNKTLADALRDNVVSLVLCFKIRTSGSRKNEKDMGGRGADRRAWGQRGKSGFMFQDEDLVNLRDRKAGRQDRRLTRSRQRGNFGFVVEMRTQGELLQRQRR